MKSKDLTEPSLIDELLNQTENSKRFLKVLSSKRNIL
jgi:hypothetical protein